MSRVKTLGIVPNTKRKKEKQFNPPPFPYLKLLFIVESIPNYSESGKDIVMAQKPSFHRSFVSLGVKLKCIR